jgi:hypothetical protein
MKKGKGPEKRHAAGVIHIINRHFGFSHKDYRMWTDIGLLLCLSRVKRPGAMTTSDTDRISLPAAGDDTIEGASGHESFCSGLVKAAVL